MKTESNTEQITALYCRLSQEDMRAGESLSIENQRLMLKEYADKNGFRNCQYYVDDGYSGTDNTRPEYVHMLSDVENGLVGTVIVKDQSRLGRDHLETDRLMELVFPAYDVRFIAVTDNVDSANGFNEMSGIKTCSMICMPVTAQRRFVLYSEPKVNEVSVSAQQLHTAI